MRRLLTLLVLGALAIAIPVVTASPVSAGASCAGTVSTAPDGKIRFAGSAWNGAGGYGVVDAGTLLDVGEQGVFSWKWKNVSASTRTIRVVRRDFSRDPGFSMRYLAGGVDVTSRMRDGDALVFTGIAPGKSTPRVDFVVTNKSATGADQISSLMRGKYGGSAALACDELRASALGG
jgi:hypothetical protein